MVGDAAGRCQAWQKLPCHIRVPGVNAAPPLLRARSRLQVPGTADTALPHLRSRLACSGSVARQAAVTQALDALAILVGHLEAWGVPSSQVSLELLPCSIYEVLAMRRHVSAKLEAGRLAA